MATTTLYLQCPNQQLLRATTTSTESFIETIYVFLCRSTDEIRPHYKHCLNVTKQTEELNHIIHVMSVVQCKYTLNVLNPSFVHS